MHIFFITHMCTSDYCTYARNTDVFWSWTCVRVYHYWRIYLNKQTVTAFMSFVLLLLYSYARMNRAKYYQAAENSTSTNNILTSSRGEGIRGKIGTLVQFRDSKYYFNEASSRDRIRTLCGVLLFVRLVCSSGLWSIQFSPSQRFFKDERSWIIRHGYGLQSPNSMRTMKPHPWAT